jgi:hypothetical protein
MALINLCHVISSRRSPEGSTCRGLLPLGLLHRTGRYLHASGQEQSVLGRRTKTGTTSLPSPPAGKMVNLLEHSGSDTHHAYQHRRAAHSCHRTRTSARLCSMGVILGLSIFYVFFDSPSCSGRARALDSTQLVTEISTSNIPDLTAICEPLVSTSHKPAGIRDRTM